jgi:hypothetical protein
VLAEITQRPEQVKFNTKLNKSRAIAIWTNSRATECKREGQTTCLKKRLHQLNLPPYLVHIVDQMIICSKSKVLFAASKM